MSKKSHYKQYLMRDVVKRSGAHLASGTEEYRERHVANCRKGGAQ